MILDVQFNPIHWTWPQIREMALGVEEHGFGTIWVLDHLSGHAFGGERMLECFTLAGALAAATSTIGIGTMVANVANRHPALLAVSAASAQEISAGRFALGIGAGASPGSPWAREHDVVDIALEPTQHGRYQRFVEAIDMCETMWSPRRGPEWDGFPLPSPPPPLWAGVNSIALAELAATRCVGINVRLGHPDAFEILDAARIVAERNSTVLSLSVWTHWSADALDPHGALQRDLASRGIDRLMLAR